MAWLKHGCGEYRRAPSARLYLLGIALFGFLVPAAVSAAPRSPAAGYQFGPGDVVEVTVAPQHSFDRVVTVQPDGKISFPIVGEVPVSGLTIPQLAETLRRGLDRDLVDPVVTVSLQKEGERDAGRVSLLGAVHTPNSYPLKESTTLAELLAGAGGPAADADLRHVTINHTDGSAATVDLSSALTTGRVEALPRLRPGDVVMIPQGPPATVLIEGAVVRPGSYPLPHEARLLDAIQLAGGMSPKADLRRITVAHAGVPGSQTLDLQPLLAQGENRDSDLNVRLQPGDMIFVPDSPQQIYVVGGVTKPDSYPLKPNERVLDALVEAGGAGGSAAKVVLVRPDAAGKPQPQTLDLKKIMTRGDPKENVLLQPGDLLYVQDKKARTSGGLLNLLYPLTSFLYLFR